MDFKKMMGADFGKVDGKYGLRLTMLGIGVLTKNGQISVYDKTAKTITTVPDDLSIGELPFFAFPADKIEVGDLVIHNGLIKSITEIDESGVIAIDILAQREEIILVSKNLFGFKGISKVISLFPADGFGSGGSPFGGDLTKNPMLMMALMGDGNLFGGDGDDSLMTMLMLSQMGGVGGGFGDIAKNPMLMMMLMKGL